MHNISFGGSKRGPIVFSLKKTVTALLCVLLMVQGILKSLYKMQVDLYVRKLETSTL